MGNMLKDGCKRNKKVVESSHVAFQMPEVFFPGANCKVGDEVVEAKDSVK